MAPRPKGTSKAAAKSDASAADKARTLEQLLATKEIVISCGSGGVGKTTTAAAAAAMAATHLGGKVLVLTVDPARRLATALGLEAFGNVETRVPESAFTAAGVAPRGELWAAMLDTKQSWDDLIARHAPDAKTREAILANSIYQNISGRFVQSHDYIAMERLYEIHTSGRYDLIVVDTPPTRNARRERLIGYFLLGVAVVLAFSSPTWFGSDRTAVGIAQLVVALVSAGIGGFLVKRSQAA